MNYRLFAGIDVSKMKIDVVFFLIENPDEQFHGTFSNSEGGCTGMMAWIQELTGFSIAEMLFCAEDTGLYTLPICTFFDGQGGNLWVENALRLKRSLGLKRGKSDKADAAEIASYGFLHRRKAVLFKLPSKTISELKHLLSCRKQLVKQQTALKNASGELEALDGDSADFTLDIRKSLIKEYDNKIDMIEAELLRCVKADKVLEEQYRLVNSVYCIGPQTAMFIVVLTQGFSLFDDPRKFACYCGIAPFGNTSGTTLKGKPKVSHLANKRIKTLLTMCALNTIKKDNEFKRYYDRKIKEGKHHSSILNVLRNKLVSRAFAAVLKERPYKKDLGIAA
ncbi:MAG: transposase [Sphingobacteriaceae bacterium]|nr:transposase [Sphingobacteriaceae bacterium]